MKWRSISIPLIAYAAILSLACNADNTIATLVATVEPPVDTMVQGYFDTITPIFQERDSAHIALDREIRPPVAASEAGQAKRWFDDTNEIIASQIAALTSVEAVPTDMKVAHANYLATAKALLEFNRGIALRLGEAGQDSNLAQAIGDLQLASEAQRLLVDESKEACSVLENAAMENRSVVDLRC